MARTPAKPAAVLAVERLAKENRRLMTENNRLVVESAELREAFRNLRRLAATWTISATTLTRTGIQIHPKKG